MKEKDSEDNNLKNFKHIIIRLSMYSHFLDSTIFKLFINEKDFEKIGADEIKVIEEYFDSYNRYNSVLEKYKTQFDSKEGLSALLKNSDAQRELLEISKIVSEDSLSHLLIPNSGKKILMAIIYSKSIFEIFVKICPFQYSQVENLFQDKMYSFEEYIQEKRLETTIPLINLKENEISNLTKEFYRLGGSQIIKNCSETNKNFLENMKDYDNKFSLLSNDFKRDPDFFKNKPKVSWNDLMSNFDESFKEMNKNIESEFESFISNHLQKIFYVFELKKYIEKIKAFKESPYITESAEYTLKRQILAITILLKKAGIQQKIVNNTDIASFIRFLTKIGLTQKDIKNTSVYKILAKVDTIKEDDDLKFVREQFSKINISI